jgi:DNA (cytosine-5)-methyltransferase 1
MLTFGSLFAGIGGFDLGLERAGMIPTWQVEIDEYCNQVLAKHWPDVKRYRDVRECGRSNLEPVDLICGGFPCQPFSAAGKQRGAEDDRNLWPQFKRIIDELRPRWVVAENVPGIRKLYLDTVLSDLEGMGYAWEAAIIPACAVDAPHRRDRLWIVANGYGIRKHVTGKDGKKWTRDVCGQPFADLRPVMAYAEGRTERAGLRESEPGRQRGRRSSNGHSKMGAGAWFPEPSVGRVANGVPRRVDRLRALGNAVVPQVVEHIGRLILEVENGRLERKDRTRN